MDYFCRFNMLTLISVILLAGCDPEAQQPERPNILFAIADDASHQFFGAYGCDWVKTPAFHKRFYPECQMCTFQGMYFNRPKQLAT
jgi:hypothetical protein